MATRKSRWGSWSSGTKNVKVPEVLIKFVIFGYASCAKLRQENVRHDPRLSWMIRADFFPRLAWNFFYSTGFLPRHYAQREGHTQCRVEVKTHTFTFSARLLREPEEALQQMIVIGEASLRVVIQSYLAHYHHERNHQGLGNQLIVAEPRMEHQRGFAVRRKRLGGVLSYYCREAA